MSPLLSPSTSNCLYPRLLYYLLPSTSNCLYPCLLYYLLPSTANCLYPCLLYYLLPSTSNCLYPRLLYYLLRSMSTYLLFTSSIANPSAACLLPRLIASMPYAVMSYPFTFINILANVDAM
jgi:hypothetical protein